MQINLFASLLLVLLPVNCWTSPTQSFISDEDYYDSVNDDDKNDEDGASVDVSQSNNLPETAHMNSSANSCNCCCGVANLKSRIVGGEFAQPHEFPWLAAMIKDRRLYCAASLITPRHLLTAAHCLRGFEWDDIDLALGGHDRKDFHKLKDDEIEMRKISQVALHPDFDPLTYDNDVAVITISKPVTFSHRIRPICLPFKEGGNYTGSKAVVVGWGRIAEIKPTSALPRKVEVLVMSKYNCDRSGYGPKRITDNMFCAGYLEGGKDSCQGDSGGPLNLFHKNSSTQIIGVVSWGRGCARRNYPGVYTKITNYMDFIHESIHPQCLCPPA